MPFGQKHEFQFTSVLRQGQRVFQRPPRRLKSCAIAIETEHHFVRLPENLVQVFLRGRRAQGGHCVGNSALMQPNHVHVALDDQKPLEIRARLPRFIQPVQFAALVKQRGLGRIHVLGLALIDHASAEADDPAARIANREHQPVAKSIVITAGFFTAALENETHLQQPAPVIFLNSKALEQRLPGVGCIA